MGASAARHDDARHRGGGTRRRLNSGRVVGSVETAALDVSAHDGVLSAVRAVTTLTGLFDNGTVLVGDARDLGGFIDGAKVITATDIGGSGWDVVTRSDDNRAGFAVLARNLPRWGDGDSQTLIISRRTFAYIDFKPTGGAVTFDLQSLGTHPSNETEITVQALGADGTPTVTVTAAFAAGALEADGLAVTVRAVDALGNAAEADTAFLLRNPGGAFEIVGSEIRVAAPGRLSHAATPEPPRPYPPGDTGVALGPRGGGATTGGLMQKSGRLTGGRTVVDPAAGVERMTVVRNALTGNDGALAGFYDASGGVPGPAEGGERSAIGRRRPGGCPLPRRSPVRQGRPIPKPSAWPRRCPACAVPRSRFRAAARLRWRRV